MLKMHAYRDAIWRSAGAYVIYPGTAQDPIRMYHEILPGLGAFALRPPITGAADGASQVTQDERSRYWVREAQATTNQVAASVEVASFLKLPQRTQPYSAILRKPRTPCYSKYKPTLSSLGLTAMTELVLLSIRT
jgi:hypothetical protein